MPRTKGRIAGLVMKKRSLIIPQGAALMCMPPPTDGTQDISPAPLPLFKEGDKAP